MTDDLRKVIRKVNQAARKNGTLIYYSSYERHIRCDQIKITQFYPAKHRYAVIVHSIHRSGCLPRYARDQEAVGLSAKDPS